MSFIVRVMFLWLCVLASPAFAQDQGLLSQGEWRSGASEAVVAKLSEAGKSTRLDYGFESGGYGFATHDIDFVASDNFEIDIPIRAEGDGNDLQIKFVDQSGDNVWWVVKPDFKPSPEGTVIKIRPRHIKYAWGPSLDQSFKGAVRLEIVVLKTLKGAKKGWLEIGPILWRQTPSQPAFESALKSEITAIVDGDKSSFWAVNAQSSAVIDLSYAREFGGVRLDWLGGAPNQYTIELSDDGRTFSLAKTVINSDGGGDLIALGEVTARFIRFSSQDASQGIGKLAEVSLLPIEQGANPNALIAHMSLLAPKGNYPRSFSGQQSYWTLIGVKGGGARSALFSEDGAIELGGGGASLEPSLEVDHRRFNWSNVSIIQGFTDQSIPSPYVEWRTKNLSLKISPIAFGDEANPYALVQYEVINRSNYVKSVRLNLTIRPFQVNPPSQFLNRAGGFSAINDLQLQADQAVINKMPKLYLLTSPHEMRIGTLNSKMVIGGADILAQHDEDGMMTGGYGYNISLAAHQRKSIFVIIPLGEANSAPPRFSSEAGANAYVDSLQAQVKAHWQADLTTTHLTMPSGTPPIAPSLNMALAYILMLKDHELLKPGARSYDRSWIRDGAMMSEGLLRMGHFSEALDYFKAYAPYQYESGKVPCCVDQLGAGPVPEHDSNGEFVWLAAELLRYGLDPEALRPYYKNIVAAINYQDGLRQSQRTAQNQTPDRLRFYGLLPPSISHEGYSDKPAYSYWDDFWALKGYRGGVLIAKALGEEADQRRMQSQGDELAKELKASIIETARYYKLSTVAGAADRGDFDPTSTTIGMTAGAFENDIPQDLKQATFDDYWHKTILKRARTPHGYTPYELRSVAAFLRLKQPQRARDTLDFFFADQTPHEWFQWAEVISVPKRKVQFLGDLPHGWVMSDYMRSALDLFAYERPETSQMVLLSGFDIRWAKLGETRLDHLYTPYGKLSMRIYPLGADLALDFDAVNVPDGGFVIDVESLFGKKAVSLKVDGVAHFMTPKGELILKTTKAHIVFHQLKPQAYSLPKKRKGRSKPKPKLR